MAGRVKTESNKRTGREKLSVLAMSEADTDARIRDLCQEILREQDPVKVEELLTLLRSIVKAGQEETATRMRFIASHYRNQIRALSHSHRSAAHSVSRIPAVLRFLGLRPELQLGRE
jgi:hypothetical protein